MAKAEDGKRPSLPWTKGGGIGPAQDQYLRDRSAAFAAATQQKGKQMSYPMPMKGR